MTKHLEPIIKQKEIEVANLYQMLQQQPTHAINQILSGERKHTGKSFRTGLQSPQLAVIAEIKRKSPSKGFLASIQKPVELANAYLTGGANALSILTDQHFFGGNLQDLTTVADSLRTQPQPILRKDFIIDKVQIAQTILAGGDAILCIVAVTGTHTREIITAAKVMRIDVIVEVHNHDELMIALDAGADIIGINNRNLDTFVVDPDVAFKLVADIPKEMIKIAESGILQAQLAQQYHQAGYDAVLIGEALVTAEDPAAFIRACQHE